MRNRTIILATLVTATTLGPAMPARADGDGAGVSASLGTGLTGFTEGTMRAAVTSSVGALWDLRVTLRSRARLALDLGYVGTAANVSALSRTMSGMLVGTSLEAAVRYDVLPREDWTPYAFVGIGWQRYDISGGSFALSDTGMNRSDDSVVFPVGGGCVYRAPDGLILDLRGTFRANVDPGLVLTSPGSTTFAPMHAWEASVALGYQL